MAVRSRASSSRAATPERLPGFVAGQVKEIQRVRILDAMARACAELGAANVTVSCVVERSGVSRRTFYELFPDGEACLLAAIEDALERLTVPVVMAYRASEDWLQRVRAALVAVLAFIEEEPVRGRLIVVETLGGGSRALERRREVLALVASAIDEGRRSSKSTDPPPLTAEGVVGGVLAVLHSRLHDRDEMSVLELAGPLMSLIVLPYRGGAAAARELSRPIEVVPVKQPPSLAGQLRDVEMRLTYRTMRVLMSVAGRPGASNRELALLAGVQDQGQISKLLTRLSKLGLIENDGAGHARGAPNAWKLTARGSDIQRALGERV
jgi:AcrR family transcriptional regulator